jgi:hypothetical protein
MKTTSRQIFGALFGLGVLSVIVPGVRADENSDWMAEMARQNDEFNRQAREDRAAMDKFNEDAQKERDAFYEWNRQVQQWRDDERKQKEWDDWRNRLSGDAPAAAPAAGPAAGTAAGPAAGPKSTPAKAPVKRRAPVPQVRAYTPAASQRRPVPQDPVAFQQMVRQNQARVRQRIMQVRQQILQRRQAFP